tara:strand:+ start:344 stop:463 length:120 start_codon:yes stop_codon:yes gene_type:complete
VIGETMIDFISGFFSWGFPKNDEIEEDIKRLDKLSKEEE